MKKASIALATMILVFGLMMLGSEAATVKEQFLACAVGFSCLFGGGYWVIRCLRESNAD